MSSSDRLDRTATTAFTSPSPTDSATAELALRPSSLSSSFSHKTPSTTSSPPAPYSPVDTKESGTNQPLLSRESGQPLSGDTKESKCQSKGKLKRSSLQKAPPRMVTSIEDISSLRLWKGIIAEFVGTMLLTMVGCGSCINLRGDDNKTSPVVQIALCFGLSVATIVWSIAHVSGGHINPAVTCAMLAARKISLAKAVFFVLFQLIGAVVGAGILLGLTPSEYQSSLGMTTVSSKITVAQAVGTELFITFVLVFTVFASCDGKRKDLNGSGPLAIGLSVTMCHLWAIDYTGSSMNTARSFGPALVMGKWDDHWVYWLGPIFGGVLAGLLYEHLFAVNASLLKAKSCLLSSDYDDDKYKARKLKVRIIEEDPNEGDDEFALSEKDEKFGSDPSNV